MTTRAAANQGWQLKAETTPGTAVGADKKLLAYALELAPKVKTEQHVPMGYHVATATSFLNEHAEGKVDGLLDYRNIVYPLSGAFGAATITTPDTAINARLWTFPLKGKGKITPVSYSVEVGDASEAEKFTYGVFTDLDFDISRKSANKLGATITGQELTTGATLTGSPTEVDVEPVDGVQWSAYFADSQAGLDAAAAVAYVYAAKFKWGNLFDLDEPLSGSEPSFTGVVDGEKQAHSADVTVGVETGGAAHALLTTNLRKSVKKWMRLEAVGDDIEVGFPYQITIDYCFYVKDVDKYGSAEGVLVLPIKAEAAYDPTWGQYGEIRVQTDVTAL